MLLTASLVMLLTATILMVVPHHRRRTGRGIRLADHLRQVMLEMSPRIGGWPRSPRALAITCVMVLGLLAPFAPGVMLLITAAVDGRRTSRLLLIGGIVSLLLALLNVAALVILNITFGLFGPARSPRPTAWAYLIPAWIVVGGVTLLLQWSWPG